MPPPPSLPARLYLLGYDLDKRRFRGAGHRGMLLRAAALTALLQSGHLADERGKAVVANRPAGNRPPDDPVLAGVLDEIVQAPRPRSWQRWVGRRNRQTVTAVRDQLADAGWLRVEPRRLLGLFPADRVTVRDTRIVRQLAGSARAALSGARPLSRVDDADAATVALAAAARLRTVVSRRDAREHKRRIAELTERTGPVPKALRKAIDAATAAAAS